jgi:hypothetical protein
MSGHDEDIDFDFFGDSEPEPPKRRLVRRPSGPPPGGPPPPRRPASAGPPATPIVRLISLIVFAIAMILILVFAVRSCETSNESAAYKDYMSSVATIAGDSKSIGTRLTNVLASQNLNENKLETQLQGLVDQQSLDFDKGSKLTPPGPLRQQQEKLVEALQLRSDGLKGLLDVFKRTATKKGNSTETTKAGLALSQQMYKFVASDVIWASMFVTPAQKVLKNEGVAGVSPPTSVFLAEPELATSTAMGQFWQAAIHGVTPTANISGSGRHGTGIAYVKVSPGTQILHEGVTAEIQLKTNTGFVVGVRNTGDYLESNVKVRLVIHQNAPAKSIIRTAKITQIYPNTTSEVFFKGPFDVITLINQVPIRVDVTPVPHEASISNNTATYEARFSLG